MNRGLEGRVARAPKQGVHARRHLLRREQNSPT